jgi:hypothetical protein
MSTQNVSAPDFVPALQLSAGEITFYQREGYLLLPGLISEEQALTLRDEVLHILEAIGSLKGASKLTQSSEYLTGSGLDRLINSPNLGAVAGQLMGGPSTVYLPFTAAKTPGGGRFHFHQDNQYTRFDGPGINLWFALCPMTPENGCLQVVPRSHLQGTLDSQLSGDGDQHKKILWEPEDFLPVRMRPGDCVAFSRLTVHGSGPNLSNDIRTGYAIQFHRDDVRATWDGGDPVLLKEHPRWNIKPVDHLSVPTEGRDGH